MGRFPELHYEHNREFAERLKEYKTSKGTIQLPYAKPVPAELISDIARWCYETGNHP